MSYTPPTLPHDIAIGAQVTYTYDVARNPSEGGNTGRKKMRNVIRNYMVSTAPGSASIEFRKIHLAIDGPRRPLLMRDWEDNYQVTDEYLVWTVVGGTTHAPLIRTYTPATGSLYHTQRILAPDTSEMALTVKVNGVSVAYSITAPGIIVVASVLSGSDTMSWTGQYLIPVCLMDNPSADIIGPSRNGQALFQYKNIRLEEILEAEYTAAIA